MNILKDIAKTILGQNEEDSEQFIQELRHEQPKTKTDQQECREESIIEQEIIKCQRLHGRLLNSTSRKLRIRFGRYSYILGKYYCETVDRVINRFAKQRQRGNCPVKAQIKEEEKPAKEIINHYFEKKSEHEFGNAL